MKFSGREMTAMVCYGVWFSKDRPVDIGVPTALCVGIPPIVADVDRRGAKGTRVVRSIGGSLVSPRPISLGLLPIPAFRARAD